MKDKLLFVHIPKTGGTSVIESFRKYPQYANKFAKRPFPVKHCTFVEYGDCNDTDEFFKFSVVRNPYTRMYSYYKQYQRRNNYKKCFEEYLNFIAESRPIIERKANQRLARLMRIDPMFVSEFHETQQMTVSDLIAHYEKHKHLVDMSTWIKSKLENAKMDDIIETKDYTPFIFSCQLYFIKNRFNQIAVDKIYKMENLQEMEKDFNIELVKINVNNGKYSKENYYEDYNATTIDLVKTLYAEDFTAFDYSTEFV